MCSAFDGPPRPLPHIPMDFSTPLLVRHPLTATSFRPQVFLNLSEWQRLLQNPRVCMHVCVSLLVNEFEQLLY